MNKFLAILTAGLTALTLSFSAAAHGPTPQKVVKEITINAAPEKVWALVTDFEHSDKWHSSVKSIQTVDGKAQRTIALENGTTLNETFSKTIESIKKIKYKVTEWDAAVTDVSVTLQVKKGATDGESKVKWIAKGYRVYKLNPPVPEGQDDETAHKFLSSVYEPGLESLKKAAESGK